MDAYTPKACSTEPSLKSPESLLGLQDLSNLKHKDHKNLFKDKDHEAAHDSVMTWFAMRGVKKGNPNDLLDEVKTIQMNRVWSERKTSVN